jgi:hypothetical protein
MNKLELWQAFSAEVEKHIEETERGHYARGIIQPVEFFESFFGFEPHLKDVCKYALRFPVTRNMKDLLKAAHYLARAWAVTSYTTDK